jgi:universal stress protein A
MTDQSLIVAAVDLDAKAGGIARRAARLARHCGGRLQLVHIVDHRPGCESDQLPLVNAADVESQMQRYARAWLLGLACHLDLPEATITVLAGRPFDRLLDLARAARPSYVVVGRSRWSLLSPLAGLSDALATAGIECDVLAVGHGDETTEPAKTCPAPTWLAPGPDLTATPAR